MGIKEVYIEKMRSWSRSISVY